MSARNGHAAPGDHAPDDLAPDAHAADLRETIVIKNVSKFYGEILGVNRVNLIIRPGVTSLVGPNGSGKTTLMNLLSGLLQPTRGEINVLGVPVADAERLGRRVGYCTQVDSFPSGMTGYDFVYGFLRVGGFGPADAKARAWSAIERVDLVDAAKRKVAGYSKGMRQRIKLAGAISHGPRALILDEPMNGLDPMARAEMAALFQALAAEGHFVIVSSHILHEVDTLSDAVVVINHGYVLAEGDIHDVRGAMDADHPTGILIRCDKPGLLARHAFEYDHVIEARLHDDGQGLLVRTRDAEKFFRALGEIALTADLTIDSVTPADDDVEAVYRYLIGTSGETT